MWTNFKLRMAAENFTDECQSFPEQRVSLRVFFNASPHASIWWNVCWATRRVEAQYGNVSVAKMLMRFLFICCLHYDLSHAVMCMTTYCRSIRSCILALRLEISCHHFFLQRSAFMHSKKAGIHIRVLLLSVVVVPCHIVTWHIASIWKERRKKTS